MSSNFWCKKIDLLSAELKTYGWIHFGRSEVFFCNSKIYCKYAVLQINHLLLLHHIYIIILHIPFSTLISSVHFNWKQCIQLTTIFLGHLQLLALLTFDLFSLFRGLFLSVAGVSEVFYIWNPSISNQHLLVNTTRYTLPKHTHHTNIHIQHTYTHCTFRLYTITHPFLPHHPPKLPFPPSGLEGIY